MADWSSLGWNLQAGCLGIQLCLMLCEGGEISGRRLALAALLDTLSVRLSD